MDCRVISVSRTLGAGAEDIGRQVAAELGYRYVDNEIIQWAAEKAGVSPQTIEQVERTPSLFDRILKHLGNAPMETGAYVPPLIGVTREYEDLIERVVRETAAAGDVVVVAHGASIPLAGMPGLLRVFVTASPQKRAERIAAQGTMDDRKAKKAIEQSDRERADYLDRLYGVPQEQPTHYDLVLNTDVLSASKAAGLIVAAARGA